MTTPELEDIEIVEDRSQASGCDEGFLRVRRLLIRNRYADGSTSETYPCDVVSRRSPDAVAVCLYRLAETAGGRRVLVILKEGPRAPIYLRRHKELVLPDPRPYRVIVELVAGIIEGDAARPGGLRRRAAAEALEEVGYAIGADRVSELGAGAFASPGISDEKVFYCAADVAGVESEIPTGDGSVMEEGTRALILDLKDAIRRCRTGEIPDMKTEVGLLRLAHSVGYLPQLDCFVDDLPVSFHDRYDALGTR